MTEEPNNKRSGWGAFRAFGSRRDDRGDTNLSFFSFTVFFVFLAFLGAGYYTYLKVSGATTVNTTQTSGVNLEDGLIGHWTFDGSDMTTATATDVSGSGNDAVIATPVNPIKPVIGKIGQGLEFDDSTSGQVITVGADASHENLAAYTLSAWIKPDLSNNDMIIAKGFGSSNADNGFLWRILSTGTMSFTYSYSVTDIFRATAAGVVVSEEWNLVTLTWDGSATATNIRMFVNGTEVSYGSATNGSGSRVSDVGQSIRIGNSAGGSAVLGAVLDDVRIYNRTLSAVEVTALYKQGVGSKISTTPPNTPAIEDGLVGHWTFDGGDMTTATATDVSGSGNDGFIYNGGITSSLAKIGQGLSFSSAANKNIYINSDSSIDNLTGMTISVWLQPGSVSTFQHILSKGNGTTNPTNGWTFMVYTNGDTNFRVGYATTDLYRNSSVGTLKSNEWQHVVVTWDGSTTATNIRFYLNGSETSYGTTQNPSGARDSDTNQAIRIGDSSGGTMSYRGQIDDVRLYNRDLSADEVAQLYALGGGSTIKICKEESVQDADANTYNTLAIGSQCWLDRNMNVGTRIAASTNQTNNGIIEKYCYSNSDTNCTTNNPNKPDGGLYQWNEAMQYSTTEGAQGICPAGFHIPTDAEWHTLEKFLTDSGQACSDTATGYRCSPAGTKLQPGGSSRFEGNRAGFAAFGSFYSRGADGDWWSSSPSGGFAFTRGVSSGEARVYRGALTQGYGFPVRCVQD